MASGSGALSHSVPPANGAFPAAPLSRYLLLAALLHGLALIWLRQHPPDRPASTALPRLEMRLAAPAAASPAPRPDTNHPADPPRPATAKAVNRADLPPAALAAARSGPAAPEGADLAAAARSLVQAESRHHAADPMYQAPPGHHPAPTPLERAGARPAHGEKMLIEGVVKIVTPGGFTYCLQRPPEVANRDGPAPVISIPMTCPIEF